jgi:uncharacterized membrane protein YoaK (UPF0700 family)
VVDAVSLLTLGVFTAAVTANVVLVGLALGDADSHTALRAALAVAGFALGVLIAARALGPVRAADRWPARAPAVLVGIAVVQAGLLAGWIAIDGRPEEIELDLLACASAVAMGGQSATRAWHTGIVTTYVPGTLTMLLGDLAESSGARPDQLSRLSVIAAVAGGATLGAVMLTHAHGSVPVVPVSLTALVAIAAATLPRTPRKPASS